MSDFAVLEREPETLELEKELLPEDSKEFLFDTSFRCDTGACGAQAYIKTTFKSGSHLLWCVHHAREAEAELLPLLSAWYSEENRLNKNKLKGNEN